MLWGMAKEEEEEEEEEENEELMKLGDDVQRGGVLHGVSKRAEE